MKVTAANGRVIAERWGTEAPQVLALHGWGRTHRDWQPSLGTLPTLAVDLPGFGDSAPPDEPQGSAWYADQVAGLAEQHGPLVVVGHSFGGRVAVHLARTNPDAVRGIVLTGAPLVRTRPPVKPSLAVRLAKALGNRGLLPASVLEAQKAKHGSADYRAANGVMRDVLVTVLHENYDTELTSLQCPVHLVWGEHDTAAPVEVAVAIKDRVPQAVLNVVKGEAHPLSGGLGDHIRTAVDTLLTAQEGAP